MVEHCVQCGRELKWIDVKYDHPSRSGKICEECWRALPRKDKTTALEGAIISRKGRNGTIIVYPDYVEIDRSSSTIIGGLISGLHGKKRIYYRDIGSVNFKKSGLAVGWIQLSILGGRDTSSITETIKNENAITFSGNNKQWESFCDYLQNLIEEYKEKDPIKSQSRMDDENVRQENPLQILKMRLVKGEITKKEYEELKDILN